MHPNRSMRQLFGGEVTFVAGANTVGAIPKPNLPEIALLGRSNVGKSSLLNAVVGRTSLARVSHTPGRTRQINFFQLGERLMLVDLPGYGYAKASKSMLHEWQILVEGYLSDRHALQCVLILIVARFGPKPSDLELFNYLDHLPLAYQIVLTKTDKVTRAEQQAVEEALQEAMHKHPAMRPGVLATSSRAKKGVHELQEFIASFARK